MSDQALLIVGVGLIGASIARAARARGWRGPILGLDRDPDVIGRATRLGVIDRGATQADSLGSAPDLVALCAPVRALADAGAAVASILTADSLVFDVGSVKGEVARAIGGRIGPAVFVPAHPIAGTERSGPEAGDSELFDGRWCILSPDAGAPPEAVERIAAFWSRLGARVALMEAGEHDALLAATSHVPHLVAYALTATAADEAGAPDAAMVRYSAGGFRDFTRIAASDPTMWRDVFLTNREATLAALDRFEARLAALRAAVASGDGSALFNAFTRTRAVRAAIVAAGQETAAANFGRPEPHVSTSGED